MEGCVGVVALALAVVMAGSGHLGTFKLLRGGLGGRSEAAAEWDTRGTLLQRASRRQQAGRECHPARRLGCQ